MTRLPRPPVAAALALCAWESAHAQTAFPSGGSVPENLLRVSIEFAEPPPAGTAAGVRLTRTDGTEIERAFYPQPLWSPDGRALTLYLDPGRVKTGLAAHDAAGRPLSAGGVVELRLSGRVLRRWRVGPARTAAIDPSRWSVRPPRGGSRGPLLVVLNAPLDRRAADLVAVADASGARVAGVAELVGAEGVWRFFPAAAWRPGRYSLRLHPDLEDPEGDRVGRSFEAATLADGAAPALPFVVR